MGMRRNVPTFELRNEVSEHRGNLGPRGRDYVSKMMRPHDQCFFPCFRTLARGSR